ncbi:MAG: ATP-binding protein, partial [Blastocatellia bacterium]|nr:ATP-binding protein [Blastocatellia bacterium]
ARERFGKDEGGRMKDESSCERVDSSFIPHPSSLQALPGISFLTPLFASPELNRAALKLREDLLALEKDFEETCIDPQTARWQALLTRMHEEYLRATEKLASYALESADATDMIDRFRESRTSYSRWLLTEIIRQTAEGEASRSKEALRVFFNEVDRLCETAEGNITVEQEPDRFQPTSDDSFYVRLGKLLKRWLRFLRRILGSGSKMKRSVDFRRLARYHFGGTLPPITARAANLIGAQPLFAFKKSRILYGQIDENYETGISLLERFSSPGVSAGLRIEETVGKMREELEEDFEAALADLAQYGKDIERHKMFALSETYSAFLRDLSVAGTFELPPRRFRYSTVYEAREKAKKEIARAFDIWDKYLKGMAGAYGKHIEVVILMDNVSRAVNETVFSVLESIDDKLLTGIRSTRERCEESHQEISRAFARKKSSSNHSLEDLKNGISRQKDSISDFISDLRVSKLDHLRESRELNAFVDILLQRFAALADDIPARYVVLDEKELTTGGDDGLTPPDIELKTVPLQEVTRSYLETEIARDLANVNRIMFEQVDETVQALVEVHQIIGFNLKACLEELEELIQVETRRQGDTGTRGSGNDLTTDNTETTDSSISAISVISGRIIVDDRDEVARLRELALGGIERANVRLETTTEKVIRLKDQVYEQIIAQVDNRMRDLETLILKRSSFDIKVHLKQRQALAQSYLFLGRVWRWAVSIYRRLILRYRPLSQEVVKDLKLSLGLHQFTPAEILAIYDQSLLNRSVIEKLPFIYQRLFDIAPLEAGDFLIARDQEMQIVETAKLRWQQGMHCAVAVIGELGSGKTSFINACLKEVFDEYPAHKRVFIRTITNEAELAGELSDMLGIPGARNFEDLQSQLGHRAQRSIIVLEDAHHLYLRTLGGFEALRRLLLLIANTSNQVLWVLSMRKYAWLYLDEVLNISDYFTFAINTENLTPLQQEQLILSRHKVSGFDLKFLPGAVMEQRKKYRRASDEEKHEMSKKEFFEELNEASEGNALAAIFYWLKSIASVEENTLVINPLQPLRFDFLWDMQIEKLLTLSMIIQHGTLTPEEHAQIFGTDEKSSLSTLTYLANINLLTKEPGEDGQYQFAVNRVIYIPLSKELRTRNIVH